MTSRLDDLIPVAHFSERHRRRIAAPPDAVWTALNDTGSSHLPLTQALMAVRTFPQMVTGGKRPEAAQDLLRHGPVPVLAAEPPRTIVAAGVLQPWKLRGGDPPPRLYAEALRAFDEPGWVKCGVDFILDPVAGGTVLSTETRVQATDPRTRARFALYWLAICAGSGLIRREILRSVARRAEDAQGSGVTVSDSTPGGHEMHPFGAALEARDVEAAVALLSADVVFHSPIVFRAYHGRDAVAPILEAIARVFTDFRYVRQIGAADAADHALVFEARVGDRQIEGVDLLHVDENGEIDDLTVMVRPLSGAHALTEAMRAQLAA